MRSGDTVRDLAHLRSMVRTYVADERSSFAEPDDLVDHFLDQVVADQKKRRILFALVSLAGALIALVLFRAER